MLWIDFETYSETDIRKAGSYKYTSECDVLLCAYAIDDGEVKCWDKTQEPVPPRELIDALNSDMPICAHNSQFDRNVIKYVIGIDTDITRWEDTMIMGMTASMPGSLEALGEAVGLSEEEGKIKEGKRLVLKFCKPAPKNHKVDRYTKDNSPEEWDLFVEYATQDVAAMRELYQRIPKFNWNLEKDLWYLDQRINDRGIPIDIEFVDAAINLVDKTTAIMSEKLKCITDGYVTSASQRDRLLEWLRDNGVDALTLTKTDVAKYLAEPDIKGDARKALKIREQLSRSSVAKYSSLKKSVMSDNRVRGTMQFYGASRTGRWAGRVFQPQNIARPTIKNVAAATDHIINETVDLFYEDPMEIASSCLRSVICAPGGKKLVVSDLSGIEARMLPWLAHDEQTLGVFRSGRDIYKDAASGIYGVNYDQVSDEQRFVGKVATLALGYQGGKGAFVKMAEVYGAKVEEEQAQEIVNNWRDANQKIKTLWWELEKAAVLAIKNTGVTYVVRKLKVKVVDDILMIKLPSGRFLMYHKPSLELVELEWGDKEQLSFVGINPFSRRWERQKTYGGKLVENVTQAAARDVLAHNMPLIEAAGYVIVMTVHDEVVTEVPDTDEYSVEKLNELVAHQPEWAIGLPLNAEGYEAKRYKK